MALGPTLQEPSPTAVVESCLPAPLYFVFPNISAWCSCTQIHTDRFFPKLVQRIPVFSVLLAYRDIIWKAQTSPHTSSSGTSRTAFRKVTPDLHLRENKSNVFKEILRTAGTV